MTITQRVPTDGLCLTAFCREPATYEVLMVGDWWWPKCAAHTASMRSGLSSYVQAVRTYVPGTDEL